MELLAGIDFSSKAIDVAMIPVQSQELGCWYSRASFPVLRTTSKVEVDEQYRTLIRTKLIGDMVMQLLVIDVPDGCEVVQVFVEQPKGSRENPKVDAILNQLYGGILATLPEQIERDVFLAVQWRSQQQIPTRPTEVAKAAALRKASTICDARGWEPPTSHDAAEALLIALTGRAKIQEANKVKRRPSRAEMRPIGPFRAWLTEIVERAGSPEAAEGIVGMDVRKIRGYCYPTAPKDVARKTVSLEVVDAALQHEGNTFLWELYRDVYPADDIGRPA